MHQGLSRAVSYTERFSPVLKNRPSSQRFRRGVRAPTIFSCALGLTSVGVVPSHPPQRCPNKPAARLLVDRSANQSHPYPKPANLLGLEWRWHELRQAVRGKGNVPVCPCPPYQASLTLGPGPSLIHADARWCTQYRSDAIARATSSPSGHTHDCLRAAGGFCDNYHDRP